MKTHVAFTCLFFAATSVYSQSINYFGQTPPGDEPVKFAPAVISVDGQSEVNPMFTPDGKEFYYAIMDDASWSSITTMVAKYENGSWTAPVNAEISVYTYDWSTVFSADGDALYHSSASGNWEYDIFKRERTETGWSEAVSVSDGINSKGSNLVTSVAADGTLYFRSTIGGNNDIYYSKPVNGEYPSSVKMEMPINTSERETHPTISPDNSYLIFYRGVESASAGIYISFRKENGGWTNPKNMGLSIHGGQPGAGCITPDSLYFIYQGADKDLYWVALENIVKELKESNYAPYVMLPVEDVSIAASENFSLALPDSMFVDDDGNETLTLSVSLNDGGSLPKGLSFDAAARSISGQLDGGVYKIKVTATDTEGADVSDVFKISVEQNTGIKKNGGFDIAVYPDPANHKLYVKSSDMALDGLGYQIADCYGKVLRNGVLDAEELDVSDLSKGVFMIVFKTSNGLKTEMFFTF